MNESNSEGPQSTDQYAAPGIGDAHADAPGASGAAPQPDVQQPSIPPSYYQTPDQQPTAPMNAVNAGQGQPGYAQTPYPAGYTNAYTQPNAAVSGGAGGSGSGAGSGSGGGYAPQQPAYYPGQPYPPQGVYYYPQVVERSWNALCIVGFIMAFIIGPIGLVLSIIAMVQISKSGEKSKGMAIAGIIIGAVSTLVCIIVLAIVGLAIGTLANNSGYYDDYYSDTCTSYYCPSEDDNNDDYGYGYGYDDDNGYDYSYDDYTDSTSFGSIDAGGAVRYGSIDAGVAALANLHISAPVA